MRLVWDFQRPKYHVDCQNFRINGWFPFLLQGSYIHFCLGLPALITVAVKFRSSLRGLETCLKHRVSHYRYSEKLTRPLFRLVAWTSAFLLPAKSGEAQPRTWKPNPTRLIQFHAILADLLPSRRWNSLFSSGSTVILASISQNP